MHEKNDINMAGIKMNKYKISILLFYILLECIINSPVFAGTIPPDKTQQVLDLLAVECQNISDYSIMAGYGDTSRFDAIRNHIEITINNLSILMNGYDSESINALWTMYNQFGPDAQSARQTAERCSIIRGEIYKKFVNDENLNQKNQNISSFDDCAKAGYRVNGGTCFIGGTSVFDDEGNLIGFYYSDCFDNQGFHPGSCWDCYYGADNDGCIERQ